MKSICTLLLFILIGTSVVAQDQSDETAFYQRKAEKFRKMKNAGTFLTVTGGILLVAGYSAVANSSTNSYYSGGYYQTTTTGNPVGGAVAVLFGHAALGAGIPLWIIGKNNHRKYMEKASGFSLRLNHNRSRTGLTLTYRF